jgi:hypothetical protein
MKWLGSMQVLFGPSFLIFRTVLALAMGAADGWLAVKVFGWSDNGSAREIAAWVASGGVLAFLIWKQRGYMRMIVTAVGIACAIIGYQFYHTVKGRG